MDKVILNIQGKLLLNNSSPIFSMICRFVLLFLYFLKTVSNIVKKGLSVNIFENKYILNDPEYFHIFIRKNYHAKSKFKYIYLLLSLSKEVELLGIHSGR